jgi:hypothetical protein
VSTAGLLKTEFAELLPQVFRRFDEMDDIDDLLVKLNLLAQRLLQLGIFLGQAQGLLHPRLGALAGAVTAQKSLGSLGVHDG